MRICSKTACQIEPYNYTKLNKTINTVIPGNSVLQSYDNG